jgi:hypothetical protein
MAKIAILNDSPEVVALLAHFLTPGRHEFVNRIGATQQMLDQVLAFGPQVIVVPLHRRPDSINRPIADPEVDIQGLDIYRLVAGDQRLQSAPLLVFGFYVHESDLPADVKAGRRYHTFLEFPIGLQELNPLISGLVGPALGGQEDIDRVRDFKSP